MVISIFKAIILKKQNSLMHFQTFEEKFFLKPSLFSNEIIAQSKVSFVI